jgi:RNA polymerase sigma-70 factor (ECF subfamily)
LLRSQEDARDIYQEAFLRVYRNLPKFRFDCSFSTWLYRIVANCSVDLMRAKQARHDVSRGETLDEVVNLRSDQPGPERLTQSSELEQRVSDAMAALTPLERAAFTLRHYEGRSIDEISRTLGLGTSAAKHSVFRAVKKLRAALQPIRAHGFVDG